MTEGKGKEWTGYHMAVNGTQANKNYMQFKLLLETAIANSPATIKFTSPDIENLQSENERLKKRCGKLREALSDTRDYLRNTACAFNCYYEGSHPICNDDCELNLEKADELDQALADDDNPKGGSNDQR